MSPLDVGKLIRAYAEFENHRAVGISSDASPGMPDSGQRCVTTFALV